MGGIQKTHRGRLPERGDADVRRQSERTTIAGRLLELSCQVCYGVVVSEIQTTETGPQVWIGCLRSYNEGRLIGEWIDIPTDTGDLLDEITRILAQTGGEEWYAGDIEGVPGYLRTDYPGVEELTEYAAALERATDYGLDADIYRQVCDDNGTTVEPEDISVYGDGQVYTDADIAYAVCESLGSLGEMLGGDIPEIAERYFDWDAYGRDLRIGDGFQIIDGYAVCYTG